MKVTPDSTYELTTDVFLFAEGSSKKLMLSPGRDSIYWRGADVPYSIEKYRNSNKEKDKFKYRHVKGIVETGTIIKTETLERHVGYSFAGDFDMLQPLARILSGPFKDSLVNILWISNYNQDKDGTPYPCPDVLYEVKIDY